MNQNNNLTYENNPYGYYLSQAPQQKNSNAPIIFLAIVMILAMGIFGFFMTNLIGRNSNQPTVIYTPSAPQQTAPAVPDYTPAPSSNNSEPQKAEERIVDNKDSNIGARFTDVFVQSNDLVDNFGKVYAHAYKINCVEKEFTIALDGTYQYLKGTFALSEFDSMQNYVYARITVFDENGHKIYVSGDIDEKHPDPINMCVDISGHKSVKVMIEGCSQYVCPITLISEGLFLTNDI